MSAPSSTPSLSGLNMLFFPLAPSALPTPLPAKANHYTLPPTSLADPTQSHLPRDTTLSYLPPSVPLPSLPPDLPPKLYIQISARGDMTRPARSAPVMNVVATTVKYKDLGEFHAWQDDEHVEMLGHVLGWVRTVRYRIEGHGREEGDVVECLAVHEFERENGVGGTEHKEAMSTAWRERVVNGVAIAVHEGVWEFVEEVS